ncbi:unnamed protein product, partial [Mesorhabditis belari]|uniref:C2H2-type domain-containing protein n=1 Tax=Mesorhabditis belari TaxID=2138241 RepID=A0AAF3FNA2_9BILA
MFASIDMANLLKSTPLIPSDPSTSAQSNQLFESSTNGIKPINLTIKKEIDGRISASPGESLSHSPPIAYEVSVPLLETGICTYPILQAVLPSILLVDVNEEKTRENLPKLFRISQMQIEYLLRSQNELVQQLSEVNKELTAKKLISALLRSKKSPVFECAACKKTFVSSSFLQSHLRRRHPKESAKKSPSYKQ